MCNFHSHRRLSHSGGPSSKFKRCLWKGKLFELHSLHPKKLLNLQWPYHLKVSKDRYHDLKPIPFIFSRAKTFKAYHVICCYYWKKKERQSDQPCSLIKITPNTVREEDKHPASKFHSTVLPSKCLRNQRCAALCPEPNGRMGLPPACQDFVITPSAHKSFLEL